MRIQLNWHGGLAAAAAQPLLNLSLHSCAQQRELCSAVWNTLHQSGFVKAQQQPAAAGSAWRVQHAGVHAVVRRRLVGTAQQLPHLKARVHLTAHSQLACAQRRNGPRRPAYRAAISAGGGGDGGGGGGTRGGQGSWAATVRGSAKRHGCGGASHAAQKLVERAA